MNTVLRRLFLLACASGLSACATSQVVQHDRSHAPAAFAGTSLNIAALTGNQETLDRYTYYGMQAPQHPAVDLPFSLVADSGLLMVDLVGSVFGARFVLSGGN